MPDKHEQAEEMRDDVPSTIARSDDKAVRTYKKTLESAEESYGDGERAHRAAYASLKHTHEKVGDHWEPKEHKGPRPAGGAGHSGSRDRDRPTAQGWTRTPARAIWTTWPARSASTTRRK